MTNCCFKAGESKCHSGRKKAKKAPTKKKAPAKKTAAKRKPAAKKTAAKKATPDFAAKAKENGRNAFLASLGFYGKAYDQVQDQFTSLQDQLEERRKKAEKAYKEGMDSYEIKAEVMENLKDFHSWDDIEGQMGKHLMKAYSEVEAKDI